MQRAGRFGHTWTASDRHDLQAAGEASYLASYRNPEASRAEGSPGDCYTRISPARFACQTFPVLTSSAVSQPPPWQKVSMHFR